MYEFAKRLQSQIMLLFALCVLLFSVFEYLLQALILCVCINTDQCQCLCLYIWWVCLCKASADHFLLIRVWMLKHEASNYTHALKTEYSRYPSSFFCIFVLCACFSSHLSKKKKIFISICLFARKENKNARKHSKYFKISQYFKYIFMINPIRKILAQGNEIKRESTKVWKIITV